MNRTLAIPLLLIAALLEAGGDALIRAGLRSSAPQARLTWFIAAAAVLFAYGFAVNAPGWDFGRLLGIYVVFFFLIAQLLSWVVFGQAPTRAILIGGALIVSGGFVIARGT
jgi:drug/metabolite transporter superfamily protein YnfA